MAEFRPLNWTQHKLRGRPNMFILSSLVSGYARSHLEQASCSILPSSRLLSGVRWIETDVSVLPIGTIF